MPRDRRRDGSKLSFSERDKRRRERRDGDARSNRGPHHGTSYSQKQYRAALEKAFEDGRLAQLAETLRRQHGGPDLALPTVREAHPAKPPPPDDAASAEAAPAPPPRSRAPRRAAVDPAVAEKRKLLAKIEKADDGAATARAIERYLDALGELPKSWEILETALGHPGARVVTRALEQLEKQIARGAPRRSRSLKMQLALLADNHDDADVRELAARVRSTL